MQPSLGSCMSGFDVSVEKIDKGIPFLRFIGQKSLNSPNISYIPLSENILCRYLILLCLFLYLMMLVNWLPLC